MSLRIKICGITRLDDALAAVNAGADALGFVFHRASPRYVTPSQAAGIIAQLPPLVAKVGVFVDAPEETVRSVITECGLDTVQLHGHEPPGFGRHLGVKLIKAFRVEGLESLLELPQHDTSAWLLDSYVPGQPGGTGAKFKWDLAIEAKKLGRPVILAGGLTPGNIASAVRQVRPYGVDVSSGVEAEPGRKDPRKVQQFIEAARHADRT